MNNGLDETFVDKGRGVVTKNDEDNGKFKVPSLRNIEMTAPYMHDGRFKTLEEVIDFYSTGVNNSKNIDSKMTHAKFGGVHLSANDKKAVVAFLKTLTDSTFITNKEFSNPF